MGKMKTKSILACAVLASVLAGGFGLGVSRAEAATVNALVVPKDFGEYINGREVTFGQKRGYSSNQFEITDHQKVTVINENPTWQVVGTAAGEVFLLANQSWGINRFSDYGMYNPFLGQNILIGQYYWREALNLLNDRKSTFFSADELAHLNTQISYEQEKETRHVRVITNEYSGVLALPEKELVELLTAEKRKRDEAYWLNDSEIVDILTKDGTHKELYWNVDVVNENGSITQHVGMETKEIYPTLKLKSVLFAYLGDKSVSPNFVTSADDSSALHITFKNTSKEKDVQVQELSVAKDKMTITAAGLATGEGQGLSGILADNDGNYVSYARVANSSGNDRAENVQITNGNNQFVDSSKIINGNYTLQLFNEKVATNSDFDYAGNFNNLGQVGLENGVITNFSLSGDRTYSSLEIGEGVGFNFTAVNREGGERFGSFWQIESEAIKVTDSLSWYNVLEAQGTITLKGSIKVEDNTLILERPENMPRHSRIDKGIIGWNDITYDGKDGQTATLKAKGNMHGLVVNGGTFTTEQDLTLTDYLQVAENGRLNAGGTLTIGKFINLQNGIAQNGTITINNLTFGDNSTGNRGTYFFDTGLDKLQIAGTATGKVKLVSKYNQMLTDDSQVEVFAVSGSGNLDNLTLSDFVVTDKANNQTYLLTQNKENKGKLDVKASRHNAVVNFAERAEQFDSDMVLFATNVENGRGTTPVGMIKSLQKVTGSSKLELVVDDAYVADKRGTGRVTGDVDITDLYLNFAYLNVAYNGGKYVNGNSYLSYFVGEADCPQDYFAYGKADALGRYGSGVSGNISFVGIFASSDMANKNITLSFFNEYGNGTSFAGEFKVMPGTFKLDNLNSLIYTVAAGDVAQNISVGKDNVVELTGTGTLAKNITGEGKVLVNGDVTADGNKMLVDFETASGKTMNITGGDVKGSLKGNFKLTGNTAFSGKSLQGTITSDSTEKLILNNDVQINGDLNIANLDGNGKTLNMQQTDGTATYDTLTIGTLKDNANWAIDVNMANLKSDKIVLNGVENGKTITLNAVNITAERTGTVNVGEVTSISDVASGSAKSGVVALNSDTGFNVYTSDKKYLVTLPDGTLKIECKGVNEGGFKSFIQSADTGSYSFIGATNLSEALTTGGTNKTVFMNGQNLTGDIVNNGISVASGHNLTINGGNGTVSGFTAAFNVVSGGTLNLDNVTFENNTTADVANAGTVNIHGSVTMKTLTGSGTAEIENGAELNLSDDYSATQIFRGEGTLNFKGNASVAVDKLGTETDNLAVTIVESKNLNLTGTGTLNSSISGAGKVNIASGNTIQTDANNLQVAVTNAGCLTIEGENLGTLAKGISGSGSLEFAQNVRIYGAVSQSSITVDAGAALDVYNTLAVTSGSITNNGSICINAGNLRSDVTNSTAGGTFDVGEYTMDNGGVYLYSSGTPESSTLTKKITNGKVFVMNDVISSLQNLATGTTGDAGVYLAGGANLTLKGTTEETIGIDIKGYEVLYPSVGVGTGTLITEGNYKISTEKVQVPIYNTGKVTLIGNNELNHTLFGDGKYINEGTLTVPKADNLLMPELENVNGTVELGDGVLYAKIKDGILNINGEVMANADNIDGTNNTVAENKNLLLTNGTLTKGIGGQGTARFEGDVTVAKGVNITNVHFADGSTTNMTVTDGGDAPLTVTDSIKVDPGAKLFVSGAIKGETYKIIRGDAIENKFTGWTLSNIRGEDVNGRHVKAKDFEVTENVYSILFKSVVPENTIIANILEDADGTPLMDWVENIADYFDTIYGDEGEAYTVNTINAYANLGENLGVSRGAYDVANMVGDAIDNHWDDNRVQDSGVRIQEKRKVWASGTRNKETVDGVELGGVKGQYDAQYNGAVVGVNLSGNFGMAINYTDGKVNNKLGGHNDVEYYGGSLYAKTDWGNLRITADATYTYGKNELSQNGITADAKTETISGGLTFKYMAKAGLNKIGPFAGIRYMHIKGRDYTDSLGINREADTINSMVVPVGLEYTAEFKMPKSEWTWKPMLMAGYIFNLGDRTNDMFLRYNDAMDTFAYDLVDKGAFFARAGMAFAKKNFTLGISYDIMKSKNSDYDRWNVNMDVAF